MKFLAVILGSVFLVALECLATKYTPDWPSLDSRPLPEATNPTQSYQKLFFKSYFDLRCLVLKQADRIVKVLIC